MKEVDLHVDWLRCDRRGACMEWLPELLVPDDWGYPRWTAGSTEVAVPAALVRHAMRAVADCPRMALTLTRPRTTEHPEK